VTGAAPRRRYLRFAATAAAASALLALGGWLPTRRLAGSEGVAALLAACAIGLAGSLAAGLVSLRGGGAGAAPVLRALAATGLRFAVVVALALAAAWSGRFPLRPLLLWTAISYLALLAVDTRFALAAAAARD
jgi:hypothetical protein